jgi:ATP-dependent 26S proteasome regulatory subunit
VSRGGLLHARRRTPAPDIAYLVTMKDLQRLNSLLQSSTPCVWITTDEEDYALQLVRDVAMDLGRPVRQWSVVRGITDGLVTGRPQEGTEHPAAAFFKLAEEINGGICVMLDPIAHLGDERTLRAAREMLHRFEQPHPTPNRLVIIDHRDSMPAVLRAYSKRLNISAPDEAEIEELVMATLRRIHRQRPIELDISKRDMRAVVRNLRGLSRRQIEQVTTEVVWEDRRFCAADLPAILAHKRQIVECDGLLEFVQAPTDMGQIGGLASLKQWLQRREQALTEEAGEFGLEAPRGVLMLGVQGAGKSLCAKAIATAWRRPLLRLDPGVLYDRYIGESERRLRDALRQAELMSPVILWIDEIEKAFASAASRSIDGGLSQRMFGTLLNWMQEHKAPVFLAATANDIEALPPELLRKGRFDEIFFVDLPSPEARRQIFHIHLKRRSRDPGQFDMEALVDVSEGYSGAEIEQGIISALHEAFSTKTELSTAMLVQALENSPPLSVTMGERIEALRRWADGRCMPAE